MDLALPMLDLATLRASFHLALWARLTKKIITLALTWHGQGQGLRSNIINLEFARTQSNIDQRMRGIPARARPSTVALIAIDYVFLVTYSAALACGNLLVSAKHPDTWLPWIGVGIAGLSLIAGLLDVLENIGLFFMISRSATDWPPTVYWCTTVKLALVFAVLIFIAIAGSLAP
jgi:hypothetical protein